MGNHALVLGASGIQGWAIVNEILHGYPSENAFEKVTAVANRPITDNILWPKSSKLEVATGVNLLTDDGHKGVVKLMKEKIPDIDKVTHLFFYAYIAIADPEKEVSVNVQLLERAVQAVEELSKSLKMVVFSTGTKAYGIHLLDHFPYPDKLPLSEDLPRTPEPSASMNFYYRQYDVLARESKGKSWTFCELRPDMIIGFVPNNNFYCLPQLLVTYLALFKEMHGEGADCMFPGTETNWKNLLANQSSQDIIARFAIHCALHPETCGNGQSFNISDNAEPSGWRHDWPILCEYFGLKGTPPAAGQEEAFLVKTLTENIDKWREMEKKYGLETGRVGNDRSQEEFMQVLISYLSFPRTVDLSKCHKAWNTGGKAEEVDAKTRWYKVFDRFRAAKIVP